MKSRRTGDLRKGRISHPGARYFLTCSLVRPATGLCHPVASQRIHLAMERLSSDGDWSFLAGTIMPDHLHVLFELGGKLTLAQVVGKLKSLTKCDGIKWQANYFEHRLRAMDNEGLFARYIYMNPYRAKLISRCDEWPFWRIGPKGGHWDFLGLLEDGKYPPAEWLEEMELAANVAGETC